MTRRELLAIDEFVKQHQHYLQGARFCIRTDHAPLRSVMNAKDPEGQLARWIEFLSTFDFEIQYRAGERHQNADALSRRPYNDDCRWCKKWRRIEQIVSVAVQTGVSPAVCGEVVVEQREALPDKHCETELSVGTEHCSSNPAVPDSSCNTIKLQPTRTREYLYNQQVADPSLKVIIQFKKASAVRPRWKDVSLMTAQSRHFGPSGTRWNSWIAYFVGDGRKEVVAGPCTRLYCQGTCRRQHLRLTIIIPLPVTVVLIRHWEQ